MEKLNPLKKEEISILFFPDRCSTLGCSNSFSPHEIENLSFIIIPGVFFLLEDDIAAS